MILKMHERNRIARARAVTYASAPVPLNTADENMPANNLESVNLKAL